MVTWVPISPDNPDWIGVTPEGTEGVLRKLADRASQAEAEAGSDDTQWMSPEASAQAAAAYLIPTRAVALTKSIPSIITSLRTTGYSSPGDGGGALLAELLSGEPSLAGFTDANGRKFEIAEECPQPKQFGVVGDGATDDTQAWQAYFDYCEESNFPVLIAGQFASLITGPLVHVPARVWTLGEYETHDVDLSTITFFYNGARTEAALTISAQATPMRHGTIRLPAVVAKGALQWPATLQTKDTGVRIIGGGLNHIHEGFVYGFTKGIEYVGVGYSKIYCKHILDCKYGRILTTQGTDFNASFTNELKIYGGRIGCSSAANNLGSAYGNVITWDKVGSYRGQNNNRFHDPTFELGQPSGAAYRVPFLFDGAGGGNRCFDARQESCKGPFAICDGGLVSGAGAPRACANYFNIQFNNSGGSVQENNILQVNGACGNVYEGPGSVVERWSGIDLGKTVGTSGSGNPYLKGPLFYKSTAGLPTRTPASTTALLSHRDALVVSNGHFVGIAVDTSKIKNFSVLYASVESFTGRVAVFCFDANGSALTGTTTDASTNFDYLTSGELATWGTEQYCKGLQQVVDSGPVFVSPGTPYLTQGDGALNRITSLSFRAEVKSAYIMIGGGTNPAAIYTMSIESRTTFNAPGEAYPTVTGLSGVKIFTPVDDAGDTILSSENPATNGVHGYYQKGTHIGNSGAASGQPTGWICTATGWLARAWAPSTAYAITGLLVINDTGKVYQLVTAGTSASSGGPTGTGTSITDGTCVWNYIGVKAVFVAEANAA